MRIFDLALKDIQQLVRDKKALLFLVAMPIMFTVFMGIMLMPPAKDSDPRLPIGFINQDQSGTLGAEFRSLLASSEAVKPIEVENNDERAAASWCAMERSRRWSSCPIDLARPCWPMNRSKRS